MANGRSTSPTQGEGWEEGGSNGLSPATYFSFPDATGISTRAIVLASTQAIAAGADSADDCAPWMVIPALEKTLMVLDDVKAVVGSTLQISGRMQQMDAGAPLLGAVPELDSMAVVSLITALEEHFDITVADDEIGAATFETLGSLARFIEQKLSR